MLLKNILSGLATLIISQDDITNTLLYRHVDEKEHPKPAFMMIVTGTNVAYKDDNGVYVVPLACLKP